MLFDLSDILQCERFKRRVNELYEKKCVVDLTEKKQRTPAQNRYLHLLLGYYAVETGNTLDWVKENYFKRLCNKDIFVRIKADNYLGEVEYLRSTRDCDTGEMTTAIERFRNWSSETCGIYLPSPEEQAFLQAIEIEMDRNRNYL